MTTLTRGAAVRTGTWRTWARVGMRTSVWLWVSVIVSALVPGALSVEGSVAASTGHPRPPTGSAERCAQGAGGGGPRCGAGRVPGLDHGTGWSVDPTRVSRETS